MAGLGGHLRVVDHLEEQIAQFALQLGPGLALDGVGDLVGFLQRVGGDGGEVLLDVPGAAGFRVAQARHDVEEPVDAAGVESVVAVKVGLGHCGHRGFAI
jgi:hypothetical protein